MTLGSVMLVPVTAWASYPGTNGLLAVVHSGDIWTMTATGTSLHRLTTTGNNEHPRWSPNGQKIAFDSSRNGSTQIYVMNANGSGVTQITTVSANQTYPSWSPNGSKLVFQSDRGRSPLNGCALTNLYELHSTAPFGTALQITHDTGTIAAEAPQWSPNGRTILYTRFDATECGTDVPIPALSSVPAAGGTETYLTGGCDIDPNWSPNGSKIAYSDCSGSLGSGLGPYNVTVASANGTHPVQLTHYHGNNSINDFPREVAWAPDGSSLVFDSVLDPSIHPRAGIFGIRANGTGYHVVISGYQYSEPDWQP